MRRWSAERLAATSGIAFVVLFVVAFVVATKPPALSKPNPAWVHYYLDHHRATLIGAVLLGAAIMFFLWFAGSIGTALRAAGELRLAAVATGATVATAAVGLVISIVEASLSYRIALDAPGTTKPFAILALGGSSLISFPIAVIIGATAVASRRARIFPDWHTALSAVAAVVMVSGGATLAHSGFFRPDGAWALVTLIVFLAWTLLTSVLLASGRQRGAVAAPAAS